MKNLQQGEYISIQQGCQQLRLEISGGPGIKAEKDEFYRQVSAQLEELDYRELYSAYSGMIRKSQVEPRILFEILVCAYMEGVYSSQENRAVVPESNPVHPDPGRTCGTGSLRDCAV